MGKNKQAQRTKNNARPSNSSRSAELLGTAIPNFVGFSAVKDGGYVPVLPGLVCSLNDMEMKNVDSVFQMVLKKMNKKDATTKYKALQEFATLCKDAELPAVEGMLPFWPRLYCALAIDIDHRVRESAQLAHAAVVKRIGKGIAIYLKQLAGAWFISQYDTYPPAAGAAANAFNSTFPSQKVIDAIVHCQWEILMYISDNIIKHTAQTLSVQKSLTSEEMETKYQRILVASLQAYSSYFKQIPSSEIEKTTSIHSKILSNSKFWKLASYDVLPIKMAFFGVLTSIMGNTVQLLQDEKKRTVTVIMSNLDESDPGTLSAVWESMLVAITKIDDWHCVVNVEKLVLPKLWRVLRSGGQCCASIVYPNLLPFVSQFSKLSVNVNDLYMNFFSNMRQGFSVKSVKMSRSETQAVVTSFVECLRYSILVNAENVDLCIQLFKKQLLPAVEAVCMTESTFMRKLYFSEVTHLIRYWSKNRTNETYKSYEPLMRQFWIELQSLFVKLTNVPLDAATQSSYIADAQIEFLTMLKNAPDNSRKKLKVKFSSVDDPAANEPEVKVVEADVDPNFNAELCEFVNAFCAIYFNKINDQQSTEYIGQLNRIMKHFASRELFSALSVSTSFSKDFFEFYDHNLRQLLLSNSETTEQIVELIFYFIAHISDAEKDNVMRSLIEMNDIAITRNVMHCSLSKYNRNDDVIKKLYIQDSMCKLLMDVTQEIVEAKEEGNHMERNCELILLAFETSENGDLLISENTAKEIVSILYSGTTHCNAYHYSTQFSEFITRLMTLIWSHKQMISSAVQVLEILFAIYMQQVDATTSKETWWFDLKKGLVRASKVLPRSDFNDFISNCACIFWRSFSLWNSTKYKILVDLATNVLEVIVNNDTRLEADRVKEIILLFLVPNYLITSIAEVTVIAAYGEVVTGNLYLSNLDEKIWISRKYMPIDITSETHNQYEIDDCLLWALNTTDLLNNLHNRLMTSDVSDDCDASDEETEELHNFDLPGIADILVTILHVVAVAEVFVKHYQSILFRDTLKSLNSFKTSLRSLQGNFSRNIHDQMLSHIKTNCASYGYMLPYIIRAYYNEFEQDGDPVEFYKSYENEGEERGEEIRVQAMQILSDHWTHDAPSLTSNDITHMLIVARMQLLQQEDSSLYVAAMEKIISYHKDDPAQLLLDRDISTEIHNTSRKIGEVPWSRMRLSLEVIRLFTVLVQKVPSKLTQEHWDFILISFTMWQYWNNKSGRYPINQVLLTVALCQLYYELQDFMNTHEQQPVPEVSATLLDEWKCVFAEDTYCFVIRTWNYYVSSYTANTDVTSIIYLNHLGKAISMFDRRILFKKYTNPEDKKDKNPIGKGLEECLTYLTSLEEEGSNEPSIILGIYHTLKHTVLEFVEQDKVLLEFDNFNPAGLNIKNFEKMFEHFKCKFGASKRKSGTIEPVLIQYSDKLGFLLVWAITLDLCANAHADLRYQYAEILKETFFPHLLGNLYKLMPVEVLQDNKNKNRTMKLQEMFTVTPSFNFGENWTEERLQHIACWLYTNCLRHLPALVRQWWHTTDSKVSATIDKITSQYVSPVLCQEELSNNRLVNLENLQVKVHPTAREVVALYQMDDTKLELTIILPSNYPLGPVVVEPGQHVSGTASWRNCHLQLSIFLIHQNGSVWDGLVMWKRNLDKKFANVEECYICFSIFHIGTYQVPKLSCHTCRKKFHTPCLYKWFNTSQRSSCPICRNVF